jgi:hypothetical protein
MKVPVRLFTQKFWDELDGQMMFPIYNMYSNLSKIMKFNNL